MPESAPIARPRQSRADGPHPFLRGQTWWARIPMPRPPAPQRSLGTTNKGRAKALCGMLRALAQQHRWDLLGGIADGTHDLNAVFTAWSAGRLAAYEADHRAAANDPDLEPWIAKWRDLQAGEGHKTIDRYVQQLRTLMPEGQPFRRAQFTRSAVRAWLDGKSAGVRNRYRAAASTFAKYLIEREILDLNPVLQVKAAKVRDPRTRHLAPDEGIAVLGSLEGEMQALHALIIAAGADVVSAAVVRVRDVNLAKREVWINGTKYRTRARTCKLLLDWAAEVFLAYATPRMDQAPDTPLFSVFDAARPNPEAHVSKVALAALRLALTRHGIVDYITKDHRHTHAVNALKEGYSFHVVARNLGHKDTALVHKNYGRFVPREGDYTKQVAVVLPTTASGAAPTGTPGDPPSDTAASASPQAAPG